MSEPKPNIETRETLLERAQEAMRLSEEETLPNRARIQADAAAQWLRLASVKVRPAEAKRRLDWR